MAKWFKIVGLVFAMLFLLGQLLGMINYVPLLRGREGAAENLLYVYYFMIPAISCLEVYLGAKLYRTLAGGRKMMNKVEAAVIGMRVLTEYRSKPYSVLAGLIGNATGREVIGESGARYQTEELVFWDDRKHANIRVALDVESLEGLRGGHSVDFILAPDGSFVDETSGGRAR